MWKRVLPFAVIALAAVPAVMVGVTTDSEQPVKQTVTKADIDPNHGPPSNGKPINIRPIGPEIGEVVPPKWRNVTPDGIYKGPDVTGPLVRVAGVPPPPPTPRYKRFYRVMVLTAGTIRAGRTRIHMAGIDAPRFDRFCDYPSGGSWPCGRHARAALRRFIRGRAVECHFETTVGLDTADDLTTDCRLGKRNIAEWLVSRGWARAGNGSDPKLAEAEKQAKAAGLGMWRQGKP